LQRARERRELGNPPGKIANPIGDQLTWEQILTRFKGKKRLWIISRDADYGTVYNRKGFLNRFLYDELCKITSEPEVYLFQDIVKGVKHFVDTTGVKAEQRLTPEESEEIERAEKALPHRNQSSESIRKILQNMEQFSQPSQILRKALENMILPGEIVQKALENMEQSSQPNYELLEMLGELQQPLTQARQPMESVQEEINEKSQALPPSPEENENDDENEEGET